MKLALKSLSLLSLSFFFVITGCSNLIKFGLASPKFIEIGEVKNQNYSGKIIKVEGTVQKVIPLLDLKGFEIKDQTDSIWVVTQDNIPRVGDRISIGGKLKYKEIVIGEEKFNEFYLDSIESASSDNIPD